MMGLQEFQERLSDCGCRPIRRQSGSVASRCPVHEGRSRSLSIAEGRGGRVLVHCFAGCDWKDVVRALGLEPRDLWEVRQ